MNSATTPNSLDIVPHLLYCVEDGVARFATWRVAEGHETVALFTSEGAATKYREEVLEPARWLTYQPPRDKLLDILQACRSTGILYASLDPANGSARTLFDIPRVLEQASQRSEAGGQRSEIGRIPTSDL